MRPKNLKILAFRDRFCLLRLRWAESGGISQALAATLAGTVAARSVIA
jgi:hypothetical protein